LKKFSLSAQPHGWKNGDWVSCDKYSNSADSCGNATDRRGEERSKEPEWQTETESEDDDIDKDIEAFAPEISEELSTNTPIESFQLFLTEELFQEITNKTNHYADAKDKVKKKR